MEPFTKNISYTPKESITDWQDVVDLFFSKQPWWKKHYPLICSACAFAWSLYVWKSNNLLALFLLIWAVVMVPFNFYQLKTKRKKALKKIPKNKTNAEIALSSTGLSWAAPNLAGQAAWAQFEEAIVSEKLILLIPRKTRILSFPKRFFTEEEYDSLSNWVKHGVQKVVI